MTLAVGAGDDEKLPRARTPVPGDRDPFVSVIVPVFDVAPDLLMECLYSIMSQTLRPQDYEVVIVDDCSSDPKTLAAIKEFED